MRRLPDDGGSAWELTQLPRVRLGSFPTPVQPLEALAAGLWVKREDLAAEPLGGNKIRALEFLLGGVGQGDRVVTVGAAGSTHALATAIYTRRLGAKPLIYRWRQEMNATAREVTVRLARELSEAPVARTVTGAYARALLARLRGAHWVPAGGSSPLGVLGQVEAGRELARQVVQGLLPVPRRIVLPLGTGGTAAGVALGAAMEGLDTEVVGVRVVPRLVANHAHVVRLATRTARLIRRLTNEPVPRPVPIRVVHEFYGGAYGRATAAARDAADRCRGLAGISIDLTYSAKALAAALSLITRDGGTTLFWLSFDGRWLPSDHRIAL